MSLSNESLIELFVDGKSVQVPPNSAIIQACEAAGTDIPRFCYHERLAIAGNCRMCLVQVEKMPKLVASCAQPVAAGMRVITNSAEVRKAREGVMEFLLANHPLDCPVCDQGGECDLQDQAMAFGSDRSRFRLDMQDKRAVEDKYLGPLIKTSMNRCIHCTRCVRFANELAGIPELGTTGRGNDMQIGTYVEQVIKSELSGNVIDLCPVGALTSKPYAFQARPWELKKTESVDVMDAVGSAIRVDARGMKVYRILPRENALINEEWLADKSRFSCDALSLQRLTKPLVRAGNVFVEASWSDALSLVASKMNQADPKRMQAIVGDFADAESLYLLRELFNNYHTDNNNLSLDTDNPNANLKDTALVHMTRTIQDFERADVILIIGSHVRHEAPLLNLRIRKNYLNSDVNIGFVGKPIDLKYEYEHLGDAFQDMFKFTDALKTAKYPIVLVAQAAVGHCRDHLIRLLQETKLATGLCVLSRSASRTAALALGYGLPQLPHADFTYLLNSDMASATTAAASAFTVYQGHHGEEGANRADVILPGAAYTEKDALYMNIEGRLQCTRTAVPPPGDARPDWSVLRALSEVCGRRLPFDSLAQIRQALFPELKCQLGQMRPMAVDNEKMVDGLRKWASINNGPFEYPIADYYQNNVISRLSPTMAACSRELH